MQQTDSKQSEQTWLTWNTGAGGQPNTGAITKGLCQNISNKINSDKVKLLHVLSTYALHIHISNILELSLEDLVQTSSVDRS